MVNFNPYPAVGFAWLVLMAYWFIARFSVSRMVRREPADTLIFRILLMACAFWLLFHQSRLGVVNGHFGALGILDGHFVPFDERIMLAGTILAWAGVLFAIWARYHLGQFWSSTVALREGHRLIRSGPYARIRHPIYTGMLIGVFGTALALGRNSGLLAFILVLAAFVAKSRQEEKLLDAQFGAEFEEHRRHTGFFLPRMS